MLLFIFHCIIYNPSVMYPEFIQNMQDLLKENTHTQLPSTRSSAGDEMKSLVLGLLARHTYTPAW